MLCGVGSTSPEGQVKGGTVWWETALCSRRGADWPCVSSSPVCSRAGVWRAVSICVHSHAHAAVHCPAGEGPDAKKLH